MSEQIVLPAAVPIALWLNAAKGGAVSKTDAANAVEVITEQIDLQNDDYQSFAAISVWLDLVSKVAQEPVPVAVALPVDGDPAGIPSKVLVQIDRAYGVVAINDSVLLVKSISGPWTLVHSENKVIHHDLNQTRRILLELIESATTQLSSSDLTGDQIKIRAALDAFRSLHLPPHLSKRSTDALEMAARVMIVANGALSDSIAIHSPSLDRSRVAILEKLALESRYVLQSVVTN